MAWKGTVAERVADAALYGLVAAAGLAAVYPMIYVFSMSVSDPVQAMAGNIVLWPEGFSTQAYEMVLKNGGIWRAYYNTLWYATTGTAVNVALTMTAAYVLSRRRFVLGRPLMAMIVITMFFSGGIIPQYILVNTLGLYDTRWAMILPTAVGAFYIIIARTFIQSSIPEELYESAQIDGANDLIVLYRIVMPLSAPIVAVLVLFYAVGHWNAFFHALLYLRSPELHPLQIFLMKVLVEDRSELAGNMAEGAMRGAIVLQIKYAAIIVVMLPILCVYPFVQKYFVQGVMIGSIK